MTGWSESCSTDQTLYDRLNKLTTDLSAMLADVRRDPKRYTKGMICVCLQVQVGGRSTNRAAFALQSTCLSPYLPGAERRSSTWNSSH